MIQLIGTLLFLAIWLIGVSFSTGPLNEFSPYNTVTALYGLVFTNYFWSGLFLSLKRLIVGVGISALIGIPIGVLIGFYSLVNRLTYIPFQFLRVISPLSWTPIAIIAFGIGSEPVYFLIIVAAVWPIIVNTSHGVQSVSGEWIDVVKALGGTDREVLRHIIFRASLPSILTGLQLGTGLAWIVLVPAEMLGVSSGLGYMILDARDINDYPTTMALIIAIGFVGLLIDIPIRKLASITQWE